MFDTRKFLPLSSAIAGGTAARISGSHRAIGVPGMVHRTASLSSYRGSLR